MIFGISSALIWLIAAVLLFIVEILSGTVALLCLSIGCFLASALAFFGAPVWAQLAAAALTTLLVFFICGNKIRDYYHNLRGSKKHISNMDAIIGREGRVTSVVTDNYTDGGRVQVDGDNWQAYTSPSKAPIMPGSVVVVEAYDSIVIRVRPASDSEF